MSKVSIVANHSPEQAALWLKRTGVSDVEDITIVPFGKKLSAKSVRKYGKVIFLITYRCVLNNLQFLTHAKFKNKEFVLFVPPFRGSEFEGANYLDFTDDPECPGIQYRLHDFISDRYVETKEITRSKIDYKAKVIDKIKEVGTILTPMMTLIYTLPNSIMQKRVTHALCTWMYEGQDTDTLDRMFDALSTDVSVTQAKRNKFKALLESEVGERVQKALGEFREAYEKGGSPNADAIGKKYSIQPYDLRYINRVVKNTEMYADQENATVKTIQKRQLKASDPATEVDEVVKEAQQEKPKKTKRKIRRKVRKTND